MRKYSGLMIRGFTLIELMIVVGILSILIALALPYFTTVQTKSRRAEMVMNLAGIYSAEAAYFSTDNNWSTPTCTNCICSSTTMDQWSRHFATGGYSLSGDSAKYYGFCVEPDLPTVGDLTIQGAGNIDGDVLIDWGRVTIGDRSLVLIQDDVIN